MKEKTEVKASRAPAMLSGEMITLDGVIVGHREGRLFIPTSVGRKLGLKRHRTDWPALWKELERLGREHSPLAKVLARR